MSHAHSGPGKASWEGVAFSCKQREEMLKQSNSTIRFWFLGHFSGDYMNNSVERGKFRDKLDPTVGVEGCVMVVWPEMMGCGW